MEDQVEVVERKLDAVINEVVLAEDRIDGLLDDLALAVGDGNNAQLRLLAGDKDVTGGLNATIWPSTRCGASFCAMETW